MLVSFGAAQAAPAAVVTVGPTLTEAYTPITCTNCTIGQSAAPAGVTIASPVNGVVIRWRLIRGESTFPYSLRVISPGPGALFTGGAGSAPVRPVGPGVEVFPTNLPIKRGDLIALDAQVNADFGWLPTPGARYHFFQPFLTEGMIANAFFNTNEYLIGINADVLPAPTIAGISPPSGSVTGGSVVTIAGTDLSEVRSVSFGGTPATLFQAKSEGEVSAVVPPSTRLAAVPITLTTIAGTTTSTATYSYTGCRVPVLGGKKLKPAKKRIRAAGCKVGKLSKRGGATAKTGEVVKQRPTPGKILPPGTQVKLTLGP